MRCQRACLLATLHCIGSAALLSQQGITRLYKVVPPLTHLPALPYSPTRVQAGLDSLGSVELRNALSAQFEVELPATAVFDYPTVAALAGFIARQLAATAGSRRTGAAAGEAEDAATWLSDSNSDGSGGYYSGDDELALRGWLPAGDSSAQLADLCTDLVGVGCIYPGASGDSGAASSTAGECVLPVGLPNNSLCVRLAVSGFAHFAPDLTVIPEHPSLIFVCRPGRFLGSRCRWYQPAAPGATSAVGPGLVLLG